MIGITTERINHYNSLGVEKTHNTINEEIIKMKKIVAIMMVLAMLFALTACGAKKEAAPAATEAPAVEEKAAEAEAAVEEAATEAEAAVEEAAEDAEAAVEEAAGEAEAAVEEAAEETTEG